MSTTKTVLGFIAGAAVGALAGILLAPDKGSNTRKKITGKATDVTDSLKTVFNDFVEEIKDTYAVAEDDAENIGSELKYAGKTFQEEVKATL